MTTTPYRQYHNDGTIQMEAYRQQGTDDKGIGDHLSTVPCRRQRTDDSVQTTTCQRTAVYDNIPTVVYRRHYTDGTISMAVYRMAFCTTAMCRRQHTDGNVSTATKERRKKKLVRSIIYSRFAKSKVKSHAIVDTIINDTTWSTSRRRSGLSKCP